jgi:hypothetical protein
MQLFTLYFGKSKKRMHPIMTDSRNKCENYAQARENVVGFHKILPADADATVWRQKSATRGGNKPVSVMRVNKKGQTFGDAGYISKNGWNSHT